MIFFHNSFACNINGLHYGKCVFSIIFRNSFFPQSPPSLAKIEIIFIDAFDNFFAIPSGSNFFLDQKIRPNHLIDQRQTIFSIFESPSIKARIWKTCRND